jgi:hypothetical protein
MTIPLIVAGFNQHGGGEANLGIPNHPEGSSETLES